jgi:hypothetical protein
VYSLWRGVDYQGDSPTPTLSGLQVGNPLQGNQSPGVTKLTNEKRLQPTRLDSLPDRSKDRLKIYLKELGRAQKVEQSRTDLVLETVNQNKKKMICFIVEHETPQQLNYLFAKILLTLGRPPYHVLSVSDFVSIHWKEHPEIANYKYLQTETILVWGGYSEMTNKSLEIMCMEFLTRRLAGSRKTTVVMLKRQHFLQLEAFLKAYADISVDLWDTKSENQEARLNV